MRTKTSFLFVSIVLTLVLAGCRQPQQPEPPSEPPTPQSAPAPNDGSDA